MTSVFGMDPTVVPGNPVAVFTGDTHLRPTTWNDHPELRDDSYIGLQQVTDYAIEAGLPVISLGDLFDSQRPDSYTMSRLASIMARLEAAGVRFFYIDGNHDRSTPSWMSVFPWAVAADTPFKLQGLWFRGLHFTSTTQLPEVLSQLKDRVDVLLCHQAWENIQRVGAVNGKFSDIPWGCTLLTGDYHVTGRWQGPAADGGLVTAYSPGSTAMQNLGETPEKYFGVLYDNLAVTWHKIETRDLLSCVCNTAAELDAAIERYTEYNPVGTKMYLQLERPILQVRYREDMPGCYDRLTALAANGKYHLFLDPRPVVSGVTVNNVTDREEGFANLESAITQLATTPQLRDDALTLLHTTDIAADLSLMYARHMSANNERSS